MCSSKIMPRPSELDAYLDCDVSLLIMYYILYSCVISINPDVAPGVTKSFDYS